jgi:O-succinylbenzoate synthase
VSRLGLQWRPFAFDLPLEMVTAHGALARKRGWLLRLEAGDGGLGWGEAAPLAADPQDPGQLACAASIAALGAWSERSELEARLGELPLPLAFALGTALAELDGWAPMDGGSGASWLAAPPSARLLPAGEAMVPELEKALGAAAGAGPAAPLTFKWKVAAAADAPERLGLGVLLQRLPATARLRLDANGGWDRATARAWAERLVGDPRLEWLEQPLPPSDHDGLLDLAAGVPVALDESLRASPALRSSWSGWQVRRPALEGDPRPLWAQLRAGAPRRMVSTALETGIGQRLVGHLAALQARGPTPTAPGLAPGWCPRGPLFAADPQVVWEAAA